VPVGKHVDAIVSKLGLEAAHTPERITFRAGVVTSGC